MCGLQGGDGAPELVSPQAAGPGHQQPRQAGLPQVPGLRGVGGVGAMNCAVSVPRVSSQQLYCTVDSEWFATSGLVSLSFSCHVDKVWYSNTFMSPLKCTIWYSCLIQIKCFYSVLKHLPIIPVRGESWTVRRHPIWNVQMMLFLAIVRSAPAPPPDILTNYRGFGDCHKFYINAPCTTSPRSAQLYPPTYLNYCIVQYIQHKVKQKQTRKKFIHSNVRTLFLWI